MKQAGKVVAFCFPRFPRSESVTFGLPPVPFVQHYFRNYTKEQAQWWAIRQQPVLALWTLRSSFWGAWFCQVLASHCLWGQRELHTRPAQTQLLFNPFPGLRPTHAAHAARYFAQLNDQGLSIITKPSRDLAFKVIKHLSPESPQRETI